MGWVFGALAPTDLSKTLNFFLTYVGPRSDKYRWCIEQQEAI
jgi:hypothetical protein